MENMNSEHTRYTMCNKIVSQGNELVVVVRIESFNSGLELVFDKSFEGYKGLFYLGF